MIISDFECVCAMLRVIDDVELSSAVCENWRFRFRFRTVWDSDRVGDDTGTRSRVTRERRACPRRLALCGKVMGKESLGRAGPGDINKL